MVPPESDPLTALVAEAAATPDVEVSSLEAMVAVVASVETLEQPLSVIAMIIKNLILILIFVLHESRASGVNFKTGLT